MGKSSPSASFSSITTYTLFSLFSLRRWSLKTSLQASRSSSGTLHVGGVEVQARPSWRATVSAKVKSKPTLIAGSGVVIAV